MMQNIRSMRKNFDKFCAELRVQQLNPDVLIFTEIWIIDSELSLYEIDGYFSISKCNTSYRAGGVAVYVKDSFEDSTSHKCFTMSSADCLILQLKVGSSVVSFLCLYRLIFVNVSTFIAELEAILINERVENLIALGDFNINTLLDTPESDALLCLMSSLGLGLIFNEPTRITPQTSTCIDLAFAGIDFEDDAISHSVVHCAVTDHSLVVVKVMFEDSVSAHEPLPDRRKNINHKRLRDFLLKETWAEVLSISDPSLAFNDFCVKLSSIVSSCESWQVLERSCGFRKPWMNHELSVLIRKKNRIAEKFSKHPRSERLCELFNTLKRQCGELVENTKIVYYAGKCERAMNDPKASWRILKELSGRTGNNEREIKRIEMRDRSITEPGEIARCLNEFFVSVPEILTHHLSVMNNSMTSGPQKSFSHGIFFFSPVSKQELLTTIGTLKNTGSCGFDSITSSVIKGNRFLLVDVFAEIINRCLEKGVFPLCLKKALVVPLHKKGLKTDVSNYRPISLLPMFSKVFEKVIKSRIDAFLCRYHPLPQNQFGFRAGCSAEDALLNVMEKVYSSTNDGRCTAVLFLDLSKAFDTVSHPLLIEKLRNMGFLGVSERLMTSYLMARFQAVKVNNVCSDFLQISSGVPQGSILGPLLFLIYIAELCRLILKGRLTAYADDISLVYSCGSWEEVHASISEDLRVIRQWLDRHFMVLSDKSRIVRFLYPGDFVSGDGIVCHLSSCNGRSCGDFCLLVPFAQEVKYLGVFLDAGLTWSSHVNRLRSSMYPTVRGCYALHKKCPKRLLRNFYFACVESRLSYGLHVWGGSSSTNFHRASMIQRSCLRALLGKKKRDSLVRTFAQWRVFPLKYLFNYKTLRVFFVKGGSYRSVAPRSIRIGIMAPVPRPRTERFKKFYSYSAPFTFNGLPLNIRRLMNVGNFLQELRGYLWNCIASSV